MGKDEIIGFIGGLILGSVILNALSKTCPNCKAVVSKDAVTCPKCGVYLKWE